VRATRAISPEIGVTESRTDTTLWRHSPPQSGKLGDIVASRNHYGPYLHKHFAPRKQPSRAQVRAREAWGILAAAWDDLTEAQRLLWNREGPETPSRRRLGRSHGLIGSVLWQKLNYPRVLIGLKPLEAPTSRPSFPRNPVGDLLISHTQRGLCLQLEVPTTPAQYILVFGSPPCKAGRSSCTTFCLLGLLPASRYGRSDITRLYCQRYGLPPVNARIFIRTKQQIDGWEDRTLPTQALVSPWSASSRRPSRRPASPPGPVKL
jgi:hypothetical protein